MSSSNQFFYNPSLPPNTIVPEDPSLFISYLNRVYEDIAFVVNNKDNIAFPISITDSPQNIPNLANFGAFIVCVSGEDTTLPTGTWSLCKSSATASGTSGIAELSAQNGTAPDWAGTSLTITSTATNFQIAHDNTGVVGAFSIRIIGTQ